MIKNVLSLSFFLFLMANNLFAAPGEVQNLRPISEHVLNTPSQESLIEIGWDLPDGYTSVTGYYYYFTTESNYTLDETTTNDLDLVETAYASSDYSGSNDVSIYVYVAAVAYSEETYAQEIGETTQFGPIRIDTNAPDNAAVSIDAYVKTSTPNLTIGGFGGAGDATQMYISNVNYETSGSWESVVASKPWPIEGGQGRKTIYVRFQDDALNQSDKSVFTVYDSTSPTASIISETGTHTNSDAIPVTIIFHDPTQLGVDEISAFDSLTVESTDIAITNASIENFTSISSGSNATAIYNFTIRPTNQGIVSVQVLENTVNDQAGNGNTVSEPLAFTYDTISPQLTLTSQAAVKTNISPIPVTITFSESVSGFEQSDLIINGGSISQFISLGDNRQFTASINPSGQGTVSIDVSEACASDAAGNTNTAAQTLTRIFDSVRPDVTLSSIILMNSLSEVTPIAFTAVFTETVQDFQQTDITLQNASLNNFSGTTDTYPFNVFPIMPSGLTKVIVSVNVQENVSTDGAGNTNTASNAFQFTFTTERPTVSFNAEKTRSITPDALRLTIVFSRPVLGFDATDINVSNGSISNFSDVDGNNSYTSTYVCTLIPQGQLDVTVNVNENVAETSGGYTNTISSSFVYDINEAPDISINLPVYHTFEDTISPFIPIEISDPDSDPLTVSVFAGSAKQYTLIEDNSNQLTLTIMPALNTIETLTITVMVTDPYDLTSASSFSLAITPVNDPPMIMFNTSPVSYSENASPISIDPESSITDIDTSCFQNGYMLVQLNQNATDNDLLSILSSGAIAITNNTISYNDSVVAAYTSSSNHQMLTITLNSSCTEDALTELLQHVYYQNISENPSDLERQVLVKVNDGEASYSTHQTIQVIGINDIPVEFSMNGASAISIPHGLTPGAVVTTLLASDIETETSALSYTFVSGVGDDHNDLFFIEDNLLKVIDTVLYDNHEFYTIRLQVIDENGGKLEQSFFIVVMEPAPNVVAGIPTLGQWGKICLFVLLMMTAMIQMKYHYRRKENSVQL
jgi:hypothetical protein